MYGPNAITPHFMLSFKKGIALHEATDGRVSLLSPSGEVRLRKLSQGLLAALRTLFSHGATLQQLIQCVVHDEGAGELPRLISYLQRFTQYGLLCQTVTWSGGKLATLIPTSPVYQGASDQLVDNARHVMSRFAYLHRDGEHFVLESPLAHAKIVLHDWRAMVIIHALTSPHSVEELAHELPREIPHDVIALFVSLLMHSRAISAVSIDKRTEEENPTLAQWEFHDLLFHARSRLGRHDGLCGASFRFLGKFDPLPEVKSPPIDAGIHLCVPDIEMLKAKDIPFTRVLEERQTIRKQDKQPITLKELGEFLYRTARIRTHPIQAQDVQKSYERSNRPYPSAGACYELEVYLLIHTCTGLPSGLYHYCPKTHRLHKKADRTQEVDALLERAYYAADEQGIPQVLIVLTARFQRVAWKYESMAYALILKHVGVLYQTMYLVAAAMGLAACALGNGDSDLFATAAGTDYYVETSVGEFMIGSRTE